MLYKPTSTLPCGESGCKFTGFLMNFQILKRVFWKVYGFTCLHAWERTFLDNLKRWISICHPPLSAPLVQSVVPDCGCKDKPISSPFPNFFTHFFRLFSNNIDRKVLIRHLERAFFIQSSFLTPLCRRNTGKKKVRLLSLSPGFQKEYGYQERGNHKG